MTIKPVCFYSFGRSDGMNVDVVMGPNGGAAVLWLPGGVAVWCDGVVVVVWWCGGVVWCDAAVGVVAWRRGGVV